VRPRVISVSGGAASIRKPRNLEDHLRFLVESVSRMHGFPSRIILSDTRLSGRISLSDTRLPCILENCLGWSAVPKLE
jgi:hypothetical protein